MEKKRPVGVILLSMFFLLIGLFSALGNMLSISNFDTPISLIVSMIIFTLYFILLGTGLLLLKKWARFLLLLTSPIWILLGLTGIMLQAKGVFNRGFMILPIFSVFFLFCFIYFMHPKVKEQFK